MCNKLTKKYSYLVNREDNFIGIVPSLVQPHLKHDLGKGLREGVGVGDESVDLGSSTAVWDTVT